MGKVLSRRQSAPLPATVMPDGTIPSGLPRLGRALHALRETFLTPESRRRSALDALTHYVRLGITTHLDQGAFQLSPTPADGLCARGQLRSGCATHTRSSATT